MSINRERNDHNSRCPYKTCENSLLFYLLLLVKALKRRSNHPEIVWIPLEATHLNIFKETDETEP